MTQDTAFVPSAADGSVIICAYTLKRWNELLRAVTSVLTQSWDAREVIVVVDNNDELQERLTGEYGAEPRVRVVANHHGPGLSGGRNTGADLASGSILLFLDDDAVASPNWIKNHYAGYTGPTVLGVGGDVNPLWVTRRPDWLPSEFLWVVGCTYTGMPDRLMPVRNPIGANMSIRSDVFREAGGFQQELGRRDVGGRAVTGTADETEFCIRALRTHPSGIWMYRPDASVDHTVPDARCTWKNFVERCQLEGGSKAVLVRLRGQQLGLASERRYVREVLPRAVVRELAAATRGDLNGLRCAGAIVVGVALTGFAYLRARISLAFGFGDRYVS